MTGPVSHTIRLELDNNNNTTVATLELDNNTTVATLELDNNTTVVTLCTTFITNLTLDIVHPMNFTLITKG